MLNNFQMNWGFTYVKSPYVQRNTFLSAQPEERSLPQYEEIKHLLPKPFWVGHEDAIACYDYAWQIAFGNLRQPNAAAGFVSNFIDTAFNGCLFMWDSSFIVMFGKYADRIFPFQQTLDNFYSHQHKDGFICREICEAEDGEHFSRFDPSSTGPNIMPWSEWESYCQSGNTDRLNRIFDPLVAYHLWLQAHHTWRDGTYFTTGFGCGMDNQPRVPEGTHPCYCHGHMVWVDACIQQVLSAKTLLKIAGEISREDDPACAILQEEIERLTKVINETLWNEEDAYYYDLYRDGTQNGVKSIGAYWSLLADIIPPERLERFVAHLDNPNEFKRHFPIPTLSADHPAYCERGGYWKGGVWAPTNYMVLKGLEKNGYEDMAHEIARRCVDSVVEVFNETHTLWENYSPELSAKGEPARDKFVGWSGLFPISIMLEYVYGIRPYAREQKIEWYVNLIDEHGVKDYPLGGTTVQLHCASRASKDEKPVITITADAPVTLVIHWNGQSETITYQPNN